MNTTNRWGEHNITIRWMWQAAHQLSSSYQVFYRHPGREKFKGGQGSGEFLPPQGAAQMREYKGVWQRGNAGCSPPLWTGTEETLNLERALEFLVPRLSYSWKQSTAPWSSIHHGLKTRSMHIIWMVLLKWPQWTNNKMPFKLTSWGLESTPQWD